MFVVKLFSFLLDITPVIGGLKMLAEAFRGKEMTGTVLVGNARFMQFLFAILSLVLDFATGAGGSLARGTLRIVTLGFSKKLVEKAVEKKLAEGFLKKGLMRASRASGKGAVRTGFIKAGMTVGKLSESKIGGKLVKFTENKLRKEAKNLASEVAGARVDPKKREEFRKKYGAILSRDEVIEAQKIEKKEGKENHEEDKDEAENKKIKAELAQMYSNASLRGVLVEGARMSPKGSKLQSGLRRAGQEVARQEKSSPLKKKAIAYATNYTRDKITEKYNSYMRQKAENRARILEEQRLRRELQNTRNNNVSQN
jgi:hypothetical protein